MRVLKYLLIAVILLFVGLYADLLFVYPRQWPREQRAKSVHILSEARTPQELQAAVGWLGAFIQPTNGGWVALRYIDTHQFKVLSMSVARDSDGRWFECRRHFCGSLRLTESDIARYIEMKAEMPDAFPTQTNAHRIPSPDQLIPLFHATNVDAVRKQLFALGFKEFPRPRP